jgi:hypothetical protein
MTTFDPPSLFCSRLFQPSLPRRREARAFSVHAVLMVLALLAAAPIFAAEQGTLSTAPLPAWEQLSPAQREQLIAPTRERWNSADPEHRRRMYDHARRWQTMNPEERKRAHRGMRRWEHMSPDKREEMRALFEKMRTLPPEQRAALKQQWRAMTPEQRKAWLEQNAPRRK